MKALINKLKSENKIQSIVINESNESIDIFLLTTFMEEKKINIDGKKFIKIALDVLRGKISAKKGFEDFLKSNYAPGRELDSIDMTKLLRFHLGMSPKCERLIDEELEQNISDYLCGKYSNEEKTKKSVIINDINDYLTPFLSSKNPSNVENDSKIVPTPFFSPQPKATMPEKKLEEKLEAKPQEIPEVYLCSITEELMKEPVLLKLDGRMYERSFIEAWLKENRTSPFNRKPMQDNQTIEDVLIDNISLKGHIEQFLKDNPGIQKESKKELKLV